MIRDKLWDKLKNFSPEATTNAGLWLDKFLLGDEQLEERQKGRKQTDQPKQFLVKEVAGIKPDLKSAENGLYHHFFEQWKAALTNERTTTLAKATVEGRLTIGLGDDGVLETSITLHHTYGVPYIRGSALKGLAAAFARKRLGDAWKAEGFRSGKWERIAPAYKAIFGETDDAGYVAFHDALYVPGSGHNGRALHADIMTVHHPRYYSEKKENGELPPPADWDEPNPVPFLSATGKYLIALSAPENCKEWRQAAFDILKLALAEEGVGAKTSSGYGRMKLEEVK